MAAWRWLLISAVSVVMPFVLVRTVDRSHSMVTALGLRVGFVLSLLVGVFYWSRLFLLGDAVSTSGLGMQVLLVVIFGLGAVIMAAVLFVLGVALGTLLERWFEERENG